MPGKYVEGRMSWTTITYQAKILSVFHCYLAETCGASKLATVPR